LFEGRRNKDWTGQIAVRIWVYFWVSNIKRYEGESRAETVF